MRRVLPLVLAALAFPSSVFATWSVVAVDRGTGRVVIASATCVDQNDMFLPGVQAVVVPGKGVAACQASVDGTHQNQMLVFHELQRGTAPAAIIDLLSADLAFQSRQFGIVDLQGRRAGHSGLTNGYVAQDMQGQVAGTEIFYSIYRAPAAPATGPLHHYVFEIYALDTMIDVPAVGASPAQTRAAIVQAMAGHVRGKGVFTGRFRKD